MRIVSLLPSATEIVYALGLGEELVGVTHECDFPPDARAKPVLTASALEHATAPGEIDRHVRRSLHAGSSLYTLDSELLERLAADLILTQELCAVCAVSYEIVARAAKRLRGDPRIVSLEPSSTEDVLATIETVGSLTQRDQQARKVVAELSARLANLADRTRAAPRPTVLVLEWTDPPMSAGHWIPELVEFAGGRAVLANPGENSVSLSWEAIADADPDAVIVAPCGFDLSATSGACDALRSNERWTALRAVRTARAYAVDGNAYVSRPGPRIVDSAEIVAAALQGGSGDGSAYRRISV